MQLKVANAVHRGLLKVTFGKFGWDLGKMPVVELTTTGRKSGQPRTVMLTSPAKEGNAIVVVASRGGDDQHPAWFLNLRDNPDVEVSLKGKPKQRMRARVATPRSGAVCGPRSRGRTRATPATRRRPRARSRWCCSSPPLIRPRLSALTNA